MWIWPNLSEPKQILSKSDPGRTTGWSQRFFTLLGERPLGIFPEKCFLQFKKFSESWSPSIGTMDPMWQLIGLGELKNSLISKTLLCFCDAYWTSIPGRTFLEECLPPSLLSACVVNHDCEGCHGATSCFCFETAPFLGPSSRPPLSTLHPQFSDLISYHSDTGLIFFLASGPLR